MVQLRVGAASSREKKLGDSYYHRIIAASGYARMKLFHLLQNVVFFRFKRFAPQRQKKYPFP
jgi:hypothetical protein